MAECYYEPTPATDGATMNPVPGAVFQVFEIADTTFTAPLSLRVGAGNPTTTVAASESLATLPGVYVTSPNFEHIWVSGSFQWRRDSIDGAKAAIQDAKAAAVDAAEASDLSAQSSADSAQAAKDAAALVDAPTDQIMADVAANPSSAFGTQLSATIASFTGYRNNHIGAVGDSITAADGSAPSPGFAPGGAYHTRMAGSSRGRLIWAGASAVGGNTVAQIVDERIPSFITLSPDAGACIVLAGTNSMVAIASLTGAARDSALADLLAKLNEGYNKLFAAGIKPIAASIPVRSGSPGTETVGIEWNALVKGNAEARGLDFLDFYTVTAASQGVWKEGYNLPGDDIHPSPLGHKAMGDHAAAVLYSKFPAYSTPLISSATDPADMLNGAGMFTTDTVTAGTNQTPGDGIADGWTSYSSAGITFSRSQDAHGVWWQRITVPSTAGGGALLQAAFSGAGAGDKVARSMLPGDVLRISGLIRTGGLDASADVGNGPTAAYGVTITGPSGTLQTAGSPSTRADWDKNAVFEQEIAVAESATGQVKVNLQIGKPPAGTVWVEFALLSVVNKTAMEILGTENIRPTQGSTLVEVPNHPGLYLIGA